MATTAASTVALTLNLTQITTRQGKTIAFKSGVSVFNKGIVVMAGAGVILSAGATTKASVRVQLMKGA